MLGLKPAEFQFLLDNVINPLKNIDGSIYAFGSRARGDHQKFSDIDIMVKGNNPEIKKSISEIQEFMSNSNFPYKVDLVHYNDFAEPYKPSFEKDKLLL